MNSSQMPQLAQPAPVTPVSTVHNGHMGIPMGHLPSGMMIPMPMAHMALPPHMQMGMAPMGLLRAPHMPGKLFVLKLVKGCLFILSFV